jgi:FkbM family methyltransferase
MRDTILGILFTLTRYLRVCLYTLFDLRNFLPLFRSKDPLTISMKRAQLLLRPGIWDYACVWEIFVEEAYRPTIGKLPPTLHTIIDLGSYLGDFAIWAAKRYHAKKVITVDADPVNYSFIPINIQKNKLTKNITPVLRAIYKQTGKKVHIRSESDNIHATRSIIPVPKSEGTSTITLKDLMKKYSITFIDYLKVDIEGAEEYVFTRENQSLLQKKVRFVALEAHPGQRLSPYYFVDFLKNLGYQVTYRPYFRWTPKTGKTITLEIQAWNPSIR